MAEQSSRATTPGDRPKIFICYRRKDSRYVVGHIYRRLTEQFGEAQVFKDVDAMPLGVDYRRVLDEHVGNCTVFLAVIGNQWLEAKDRLGGRALDSADDFVRLEIEAALRRDVCVIPVLVDEATIPDPNKVPSSITELVFRQGVSIRPDPDFDRDLDRLIAGIERTTEQKAVERQREESERAEARRKADEEQRAHAKRRQEAERTKHREEESVAPTGHVPSPVSGVRSLSGRGIAVAAAAAAIALTLLVVMLQRTSRPQSTEDVSSVASNPAQTPAGGAVRAPAPPQTAKQEPVVPAERASEPSRADTATFAVPSYRGQWSTGKNALADRPTALAVDSRGLVYVGIVNARAVRVFDSRGTMVREFGIDAAGEQAFVSAVDVDAAGNAIVAWTGGPIVNSRSTLESISVVDRTGAVLRSWGGSRGGASGHFNVIDGLALDTDSNVYVAESWNHRIQVFSPDGKLLRRWGGWSSRDGEFRGPSGIAISQSGEVYVVDTDNNRLQVFDRQGRFLRKWGSKGAGDGQFNGPSGVDVADSGAVYVADFGNHRIQAFDTEGRFLGKWGRVGSGDGQFRYPNAVALGGDGTVYVADRDNVRIQAFAR
jgi:hypothetical protein